VGYVLNLIYSITLIAASPWLLWRFLRWGKNRRGWGQKLFGLIPQRSPDDSRTPCIWFHAVSVGEVNLLAPVLQRMQHQRPDIELVISTTTETGFDLATQKYPSHPVFFFPFDFTWAVRRALHRIQPDLIVMAELEVWPNFVRAAGQRLRNPAQTVRSLDPDFHSPNSCSIGPLGTKIAIINGRLSESSLRGYRRFHWLLKTSFRQLSLVAAQNETYANRFLELGCPVESVVVTGSVKFDGVQTDRQNPKSMQLAQTVGLGPQQTVFLAGSTQLEEDLLAAKSHLQLAKRFPQLRLVLAPRHPERCPALIRELHNLGLTVRRRSEFSSIASNQDLASNDVLLIDVIGELGAWWGVADLAYVGGSMGSRNGQNMIEPAAYGIPISFGPHTANFREVVTQLLAADAATVVHDQLELNQFILRVLTDPNAARQMGQRAQTEILRHHGASDRTIQYLLGLLPPAAVGTPLSPPHFGKSQQPIGTIFPVEQSPF
jgi:3-deoxy-D-manno-octulosonic-acid transferase